MHVCTYTYHTCMHSSNCVHASTCMSCMYMYIYIYIYTYIYIHTEPAINHSCMYVCIYAHTCIHTHVHTGQAVICAYRSFEIILNNKIMSNADETAVFCHKFGRLLQMRRPSSADETAASADETAVFCR